MAKVRRQERFVIGVHRAERGELLCRLGGLSFSDQLADKRNPLGDRKRCVLFCARFIAGVGSVSAGSAGERRTCEPALFDGR